jgi:flagellar biosynthetic protein FlhB
VADQPAEKTQEPTPHKRQQAREQGQAAKSQDLASATILLVGASLILFLGQQLSARLVRFSTTLWGGDAWTRADAGFAISLWHTTIAAVAPVVLPVLAAVLLAAILIELFQVGLLWVPARLVPDLSRLDPMAGLRRIFSLSGAVRLMFGLFKILLVAGVAWWALQKERTTIMSLAGLDLPQIAAYLGQVVLWTTLKIGGFLFLLAIFDYGYQWWRNEQDLRMTVEEVREEMRNLQGDPQILARRRSVQRQLVLNRLGKAVPKADVVVTNPTELAVAIQYEPESMAAPIVVAKGAGVLAARIRNLAQEHGIPVLERKPLAQALYKQVDIGRPIPQGLYAAVAELLAYVYQIRGKKAPARKAG